ncbi:PLP-dependent aminotransferase family protein [Streptomyces sp. NBC_01381]|uniref:aminotransferase-like domain-containing protein n=1 Tax=Streptomyces sp. NBC_01381 TaxID=2903845 RepID=UPI0022527CFE|nr:PLP-dependent aminotransferase family protein [Streptomyces sp. NBC_01381]MCX4665447.1 PLP-dependent aminotransferase family protein [Streptomyces sp. NBC_01381]
MARSDYRLVADEVAGEIERGLLRPGDQLPTQRAFARQRRIANSTAIRVYGELVRRGLAVGEVGRGTFVRAAPPHPGGSASLAERPRGADAPPVNLELNYPVTQGQSELMARGIAPLLRPDVLLEASRPAAADGTPQARAAAADVLARAGWRPDPAHVLFAGNGRQAIAAAISSLVRPGGRLGVEELTYPLVKAIAERLGVSLVPVAVDEEGIRPDALAAVHRSASPLSAVYVQPTLHNPLSLTAGPERRAELAGVLRELDLYAVEDTTWAFLAEDAPAPLAAYAPDRTVLVDSLSKRLAPGLTVGMLTAPPAHLDVLARTLRSGAWTAGGVNLEAAVRWCGDGTVDSVVAAKRVDAAVRHRVVEERLGVGAGAGVRPGAGTGAVAVAGSRARSGRVRVDPRSYFCWWELPSHWRAEAFVAAAAERGVAVTPGSAFAIGERSAPGAVRIGLASPPVDVLGDALGVLAELARRAGPGAGVDARMR